MKLITGTYSDEEVVKSFLVPELYEGVSFSNNIANQAKNAKKWANTYIGKQADFSDAELAEVKNEGIILATSRYTACLMELKRQERAPKIAEETKMDCNAAETILIAWCHNNGIVPASEKKAAPTSVEILFVHSEKEYVI